MLKTTNNQRLPRISTSGYSLAEILITSAALIIVIAGLIQLFIYGSRLSDLSRAMSFAITEAQAKMEEIRNSTYTTITANYASGGSPGNTFTMTQGNGRGIIYIDSTNANLLQIDIVVSFSLPSGRVIGEDLDLDGNLDAGEDTNGNGRLDSPATIVSLLAQR